MVTKFISSPINVNRGLSSINLQPLPTIAKRLTANTDALIGQGINVLAVMSNDDQSVEQDSPPKIKLFSKQHGFNFPYLIDEDRSVGRAYGAVCTPNFFGLNKPGELQCRERLENLRMDQKTKQNRELVDAILTISETGCGPEQQIPSMGCSIKWRDHERNSVNLHLLNAELSTRFFITCAVIA